MYGNWSLWMSSILWRILIPELSRFLILKKRHAELILELLDRPKEAVEISEEMRRLTRIAHEEKFRPTGARSVADESQRAGAEQC